MIFIIGSSVYEIFRNAICAFSLPQGIFKQWHTYEKTLLAAGAVLALSSSFTVNAAENDKPQYLSDWWHQSVNVVGSYHTRFGPQIRNDTYLEYEAFAKKTGSTSMVMRMRRYSSAVTPMQRYLEPRFSSVYGNRTTFLHRQADQY